LPYQANNKNNNNNNNQICIAQVFQMTSEALDGQLQSCYTARAQGCSDGGYITIYTLPKSGQVNFYGVKMTS